ncbi:MAG: hypothetical protein WAW13_00880 [Minisyncoccia bacterium]
MNETTLRGVAIKSIAIIGFFATIIFIVWLATEGIKRAPAAFSSLASIAESVSTYRAVHELNIATEKTVVNSDESFQITWTDVKQAGEYHFSYACTSGVDLLVRSGDGALVPVSCTDTLSLPATVHGLFLSVNSEDMRFTDIPLKVSFTNVKNTETLESEAKVTVVNATIPTTPQPVASATTTKPTEVATAKPEPVKPVEVTESTSSTPVVTAAPKPAAKPVTTIVYPQSNPNGYSDLSIITLGSGILKNDIFTYTAKYDRDLRNSIKFDIRNIGTKTSKGWRFETILPNGTIFKSDTQAGLMPNEHVEFTLSFTIDEHSKTDLVKITNTVYTSDDTNSKNNSSVWHVTVQD